MVGVAKPNHLVLNIYASGNYKYNVVKDSDLEDNIEFNKQWRGGRLIYVDGKRVYGGCIIEDALGEYDEIAKDFFENKAKNIDMLTPTIPYE